MLNQYEWIAEDEHFFGQPNTAYDFKETDPHEAGKRIQRLQEIKDKLSRSVNTRAMNLLGKAEEQVRQENMNVNYSLSVKGQIIQHWL